MTGPVLTRRPIEDIEAPLRALLEIVEELARTAPEREIDAREAVRSSAAPLCREVHGLDARALVERHFGPGAAIPAADSAIPGGVS
jgi:hypothetical protein